MGELREPAGKRGSREALSWLLASGTRLLREVSPGLLWRGAVALNPEHQLLQNQGEWDFVWKSESSEHGAGHVKMLALFQLQALLAKRLGMQTAQPSLALTVTLHFSPHPPFSCNSLLRRLLHSQPLTMSSCPSTIFISKDFFHKNPSPQTPSWDRQPSGITQSKSQDVTLAAEILLAHTTVLPGYQRQHKTLLQVSNNPPFTFS